MKTLLTLIFILSTTSAFAGINKSCESIVVSPDTKCKTNKLYWLVGLDFSFRYTCSLKNPIQARRTTIKSTIKSLDFETSFACNEILEELKQRSPVSGSESASKIVTKTYKSINEISHSKLKVTTVGNKSLVQHINHTTSSTSGYGKTAGNFTIGPVASDIVEHFSVEDLRNGNIIEAFGKEFIYKK